MATAYVEIPLTQGKVAVVDIDDAPVVAKYKWCASRHGGTVHAVRSARTVDGRKTTKSMHQLLTGFALTDHANGDGLDNRRFNLRPARVAQNIANQQKRAGGTSAYKGVSWQRQKRAWRAQITSRGKRIHIGLFASEVDAAHAYDDAARALHREFATVNFPRDGERSALANRSAVAQLIGRAVA